ncbi:MAG: hypothetical protein ABSF71_14110 [Terriglobia bacterium]|jgi:predicted Holliday junction resolvase-like endonuclease
MDSGLSTVRNLLYIVLVLALLSVFANIYVGTQLAANSEELSRLGLLLQKQLMTNGVEQSEKLQEKMQKLNEQADGIDAKLQKAQDDFVKRMNADLPPLIDRTMDNYIKTRAPAIERQAIKQMPH